MSGEIENIIEKKLEELPESARRVLVNSNWRELVQKIVKEHNLTIDQEIAIEAETQLVLLGFEQPINYIHNLMEQADVDQNMATIIYKNINKYVFIPVEEAIKNNTAQKTKPVSQEIPQKPQISKPQATSVKPPITNNVPQIKKPEVTKTPVIEKPVVTTPPITPKVEIKNPYNIPAPTEVPPIPVYEDSNQKYREVFEKENKSINEKSDFATQKSKTLENPNGLKAEVGNILGKNQQFGAKLPDEEDIENITSPIKIENYEVPQKPQTNISQPPKELPNIKEPVQDLNLSLEINEPEDEEIQTNYTQTTSSLDETSYYSPVLNGSSAFEHIKKINQKYRKQLELETYGMTSDGRTIYKKAPVKIFENRIPGELDSSIEEDDNILSINKNPQTPPPSDEIVLEPIKEEPKVDIIETIVKKIDEVPHKIKKVVPIADQRTYRVDPYREPIE